MDTEDQKSTAQRGASLVGTSGGFGVSVADGKYTIQADGDGRLRALRYGQPWRELTGDGMVLALAQEIDRLREGLARLRDTTSCTSGQYAIIDELLPPNGAMSHAGKGVRSPDGA
jgi:hypothetical protein